MSVHFGLFSPLPGFKCAVSLFHLLISSFLVCMQVDVHGFSHSVFCSLSILLTREQGGPAGPWGKRSQVLNVARWAEQGLSPYSAALSQSWPWAEEAKLQEDGVLLAPFQCCLSSAVFHQKSLVLATSDDLSILLQRLSSAPSESLACSVSPSQTGTRCFSVLWKDG